MLRWIVGRDTPTTENQPTWRVYQHTSIISQHATPAVPGCLVDHLLSSRFGLDAGRPCGLVVTLENVTLETNINSVGP